VVVLPLDEDFPPVGFLTITTVFPELAPFELPWLFEPDEWPAMVSPSIERLSVAWALTTEAH
jgi:hypothetical protein